MVVVEEYHHHIFIIKFFLKAHQTHPLKYSLLTSYHESTRIFATCIKIAVQILKKNPLASLGFIGAATEEEEKAHKEALKDSPKAKKSPTKRFNVYTGIVARLFSPDQFLHVEDTPNSAYAIINLKNNSPQRLKATIEDMFHKHYILASAPQQQVDTIEFPTSQSR